MDRPGNYFDASSGLWFTKRGLPVICMELSGAWTRLGVLFTLEAAREWVDLEELLIKTAKVARHDERLFVMAASWLSVHHHLLDTRALKRALKSVDDPTSATLGALLAMAREGINGPTPLAAALSYCRPLTHHEPLFLLAHEFPMLLNRVKKQALPLFDDWGFWHNDSKLKANAIRPVGWILANCPEMRPRALLGPGLDAEILASLAKSRNNLASLARNSGATYAAAYASTARLLGKGMVIRGKDKKMEISTYARSLIDLLPLGTPSS